MSPFSLGILGSARVAGGAWLPTDVTGCVTWLAADALSLSNGQSVTTWPDASGEGNDFTAVTAGVAPKVGVVAYATGATPAGGPAVRIEQDADIYEGPEGRRAYITAATNFMSGKTSGEIFLAVKPDRKTGSDDMRWAYHWGSSAEFNHMPFSDGNTYDGFGSTARKSTGATVTNGSWNIISIRSAPSLYKIENPGGSLFSTTSNTVAWSSSPHKIGQVQSVYTSQSRFYWAEIIVYDHALSDADRADVFSYLGRHL